MGVISREELEKLYEENFVEIKEGEILKGKVIKKLPDYIVVDVGFKSEALIPKEEFEAPQDIKEGDEVEVYVESKEDEEGRLLLSYQKAKRLRGWEKLIESHKEGDIVEGVVKKRIKGGFYIDIYGMEAFLPGSLSLFKGLPDSEIIGKTFKFMLLKIYRGRKNVIVSRKDAVIKEKEEQKRKLWESLETGKVLKGKVKSMTDFGAFIDLGGVDGLLHITDISWKKINHPSEVLKIGQEIEVMVLNFDKDTQKISLGLKQLTPDPWQNIEEKYPVGSVVKGKITNILPYGLFVEIEPGIEGLIHAREVSWSKKLINLQENFKPGQELNAKVIRIEKENRKIALSIKQLTPDPWQEVQKKYPPGVRVRGEVVGFLSYGVFVEIEPGIEGIVYLKDLSWTKRVSNPQEYLKKGQIIEALVLGIDRRQKKLILGIKQLKPNPWPEIMEKYTPGKIFEGKVAKITNFGIFVELEKDLEGLVYKEEIEKERMQNLKPGDSIKVKILKVDAHESKISLSCKGIE